MGQKPGLAGLACNLCAKFELKLVKMKFCNIRISDKDIGGGWEGSDDGVDDVRDEVKATVDGLFSED
jgi:hypothetical protein